MGHIYQYVSLFPSELLPLQTEPCEPHTARNGWGKKQISIVQTFTPKDGSIVDSASMKAKYLPGLLWSNFELVFLYNFLLNAIQS
jgi:hypothetical protein